MSKYYKSLYSDLRWYLKLLQSTFQALSVFPVMLKRVSTSLSAFVVLASKIWAFVVYVFKKQTRAVRLTNDEVFLHLIKD